MRSLPLPNLPWSASAIPAFSSLVGRLHFVQRLPQTAIFAHGVAFAIAFGLITYMHVILGELVPKTLALQRAEQIALAVAAPMEAFLTITRPILFFMRRSGGLGGLSHSADWVGLRVSALTELM